MGAKPTLERALAFKAQLNARQITLKEVALQVGCSVSYLYSHLSPLLRRKKSSTKQRAETHDLVVARSQLREQAAWLYVQGRTTVAKAAKTCKCSESTIYKRAQQLKKNPVGRRVRYLQASNPTEDNE